MTSASPASPAGPAGLAGPAAARQPTPIASTVYRLADSRVVIAVTTGENGPMPLFTEVSGDLCAVAYTDPEEARRDAPDGARVFEIQVAELLRRLPPVCGLLVDPRAPSPVFVAPGERALVLDAAVPFPAGAVVRFDQTFAVPEPVLARLRDALAAVPTVRRAYCTRYQVADVRVKLLVAVDADAATDAVEAAFQALREAGYSGPAEVATLASIPETLRRIVLTDIAPCYIRADPGEPEA